MRPLLLCFACVIAVAPTIRWNEQFTAQPAVSLVAQATEEEAAAADDAATLDLSPDSDIAQKVQSELEGKDFSAEKVTAANTWLASSGVAEWMGPLAPVAISPFFGVTCLSALALWGPESLSNNALVGSTGPLKNEWLFIAFAVLTTITSVPRFTKVSKPFAQAVDQLEAYSVIVILLAIKVTASLEASSADTDVAMIQMGFMSFTADTLLALAMVINIVVINSVKFFFEFLVWLTPVPMLDGIFEICNKTLCAALLAVYAFSPTLATIINLCLLVMAAIVFRWINRQVRFYRTMVLDPVLSSVFGSYGIPKHKELVVFSREAIGPFKAKSKLKLRRDDTGDGWTLHEGLWWMPSKSHPLPADCNPSICKGWVIHRVKATIDDREQQFLFSRRFNSETIDQLAADLGIAVPECEAEEPVSNPALAADWR